MRWVGTYHFVCALRVKFSGSEEPEQKLILCAAIQRVVLLDERFQPCQGILPNLVGLPDLQRSSQLELWRRRALLKTVLKVHAGVASSFWIANAAAARFARLFVRCRESRKSGSADPTIVRCNADDHSPTTFCYWLPAPLCRHRSRYAWMQSLPILMTTRDCSSYRYI